jgi:hypothetical protein
MKQIPYWGLANIRCYRAKSSRTGDLAPGISASLNVYTFCVTQIYFWLRRFWGRRLRPCLNDVSCIDCVEGGNILTSGGRRENLDQRWKAGTSWPAVEGGNILTSGGRRGHLDQRWKAGTS